MKTTLLITLLLSLAAALIACATAGNARGESTLQQVRGDWRLVAIDGQPIDNRLVNDMRPPEMRFDNDGRLSGFSGVNRFTTNCDPVELAQERFECDAIAGTRMAGPPEAMRLEADVLDRLRRARKITVEDDRLRLNAGGAPLLEFRRAP